MKNKHYTVVIPTRERADTLYYTLKSCIMQDYDGLTILVCDNNSQDNTKEIVEYFEDPRIQYINSGKRLSMSDNWEFALDHVSGDFVTFIGDDDGLLMGSINSVNQLFNEYDYEAITWKKIEYCWPSHIVPEYRNLLNIPLSNACFVFNGKNMLKKLMSGEMAYNRLPCIYNSFISMELIKKIKEKYEGHFFHSLSPDVYSSIIIAENVDEYLYSNYPLSINGASGHSNGTLTTNSNSKENNNKKVNLFLTEYGVDYPRRMEINAVSFAVLDSLLAFEEVSGEKNVVNMSFWIDQILKDLQSREPTLYFTSIKTIIQNKELFEISFSIEDLISKYPNKYEPVNVHWGYSRSNNSFSLNAQNFNISTVLDASLFCTQLFTNRKPKLSKCVFLNRLFGWFTDLPVKKQLLLNLRSAETIS